MSKSKSKCLECGGSGVVVLLTSSRPCKTCAARKKRRAMLNAAPSDMEYTYDSHGRLIRAVWSHPAAAVTTYTYYELEQDEAGNDGNEKATACDEPPRIGPSKPAPLEGDNRPFVWFHENGAPGRKIYAHWDGWRWCMTDPK